ncbi:MAG: choline dehydrogenase [Pseudomonadota bacterium]
MNTFDYIIVGAGSAGCVLASKLGADGRKTILIVEAGPMDHDLMIHVPAGVYRTWHEPKLNWNYHTEPEPALDNRTVFMPRGKVVGGSSSINSMVYMRGHPLDYDRWADECGLTQWSYEHCLPYFKAGETSDRGGDDWRGDSGPLGVSKGVYENPLYDAFIAAGEQAGQGRSDDLNGYNPEGVARLDATRKDGRRCSAAVAHLRPALKRGNVTLLVRAMVKRVLFTGNRAYGVALDHKGAERIVHAGRQVILAGGAINSPQLLMLSGVGPADHLNENGIRPLVDLPGVGQNLQDHASVILQYECMKSFPIHKVDAPWRKAAAGLQWVFTRSGIAASNIWEAGGLIRGNDRVAYPNLQYHFGPVGFEYDDGNIKLQQAFAIHVDQLRPRSRGSISLKSGNPYDKPAMHFEYLAEPGDLDDLVEGVHKTRELVAQDAFDGLRGVELVPGTHVNSEAEIRDWVRSAVTTDFHPCGTCRMGHGPDSVVDDQMRVHGVEGLSVVDASVMPQIMSANLNAPVQMMAARAADYMTGSPQLAPTKVAFAFQH